MSDPFDDLVDRQSEPGDPARIAAVSVPRGNAGRGETRRRRPCFLQRCRNDTPLSVATNGPMKTRPRYRCFSERQRNRCA